jgi:AAA15 family ATPase/GTPase
VTTHDTPLMDQELLRRDEIWLAEKNDAGATTVRSLCEFKDLRFDTEPQGNYLTGRFGGVPVVKHRPYFRAGIHQTV